MKFKVRPKRMKQCFCCHRRKATVKRRRTFTQDRSEPCGYKTNMKYWCDSCYKKLPDL